MSILIYQNDLEQITGITHLKYFMIIRFAAYSLFEEGISRCSAPLLFLSNFILQRFWCAAPYLVTLKGTESRDICRN